MRICCALLVSFLVVGVPFLLFGQSGNARSKKNGGQQVSPSVKSGQKTNPDRDQSTVTPISPHDSESLADARDADLSQIQSDLQAVAAKLSAMGLKSECNQVRAVLEGIRERHSEKQIEMVSLQRAVETEPAAAIGITVTWFEIDEDASALESIKEQFPAAGNEEELADAPWEHATSNVLSTEVINWLFTLHNQGQVQMIRQQRSILVDGSKEVFIQGMAVDIYASQTANKIVQRGTTENNASTSSELGEMLRRPNTALDGSAIRATAEVLDQRRIELSVNAQLSYAQLGKSKFEALNTHTRRIQARVEVADGQSFAMFWPESPRIIVESKGVRGLDNIPKIGPKLFAKKTRTEQSYLLCLVTPKIMPQTDEPVKKPNAGRLKMQTDSTDER